MSNLKLLIQFWNHLKGRIIKADRFAQIFPEAVEVVEEAQVVAEEVRVEEVIPEVVVDEVQEEEVIPEAGVPVHQVAIAKKKIHVLIILINQVMLRKNLLID